MKTQIRSPHERHSRTQEAIPSTRHGRRRHGRSPRHGRMLRWRVHLLVLLVERAGRRPQPRADPRSRRDRHRHLLRQGPRSATSTPTASLPDTTSSTATASPPTWASPPSTSPVDAAARTEVLASNKVDITLANFTVTPERAEKGSTSRTPTSRSPSASSRPASAEITDVSQLAGKTLIVTKGTTAEAYFEANHPEVKLLKFDQYSDAYQALEDGRGDAFSTDNTEVIAWAIAHPGLQRRHQEPGRDQLHRGRRQEGQAPPSSTG